MFYFALTNKLVSIHAPTWGATRHGNRYSRRILFQSTHPHEVRPYLGLHPYFYLKFQSTHPHRVRPPAAIDRYLEALFQSTHPHRVRPSHSILLGETRKFQSTHPHRVRPNNTWYSNIKHRVSIHAPT